MTRNQIRQIIYDIIEDIEPYALDDSDLHIPVKEIEKATDRILELWDKGFTYDTPSNS